MEDKAITSKIISIRDQKNKVINTANGRRIGILKGFIQSNDKKSFVGIVYKKRGGLLGPITRSRYLLYSDIRIGEKAIMVPDIENIYVVPKLKSKKAIFSLKKIGNMAVLTENGSIELGKVKDCFVDASSGAIEGYKVGKWAEERTIRSEDIISMQDCIIVKDKEYSKS